MGEQLRAAFEQAMQTARWHYMHGEWSEAFVQLERAHVLGQRTTVAHMRSHWWMLRVGWQRGDAREWTGQLTRIVAAALFSRIWVSAGNTGGANVSPMKPMPIAPDLQALLDADRRELRRGFWASLG